MPLDHQIDSERNVVVARVTGELDAATLLAYLETVKRDPRLRPGYRSYFDLSEALPCQIDAKLPRRAAEISRSHDERLGAVRVAVVAPQDLAFGLARIYATLTDPLRREVRVFRDAAAARAWLDIPDPESTLAA